MSDTHSNAAIDRMAGDTALLAAILRRWLSGHADGEDAYSHVDDDSLTLDGEIDITPEEAAALRRAAPTTWRERVNERLAGA